MKYEKKDVVALLKLGEDMGIKEFLFDKGKDKEFWDAISEWFMNRNRRCKNNYIYQSGTLYSDTFICEDIPVRITFYDNIYY